MTLLRSPIRSPIRNALLSPVRRGGARLSFTGSLTLAEDFDDVAFTLVVLNDPAMNYDTFSKTSDAGSIASLAGAEVTISGLDYEVATSHELAFAVNASDPELGLPELTLAVTVTVTNVVDAPGQFTSGQWSVSDDTTGGDITIAITALPSAGDSAITALEYRIDSGSWVSLGGTTTGDYQVSGLTDDVQVAVSIRAVNAIGNGAASATKNVTPTTASGYHPDADAYFAAMSSAPDTTRKGHLNDLIEGLISDGVWSKLDALYVLAAHDAQAARVNAKNPASVATEQGTVTFTTDRGYAGNGTTGYLQTNVAGTTLTATDSSLFAFVDVKGSARTSIIGYRLGRHVLSHGASLTTLANVMASTGNQSTTTAADDQFVCAARTGTTQELQVGTSTEDTDTITSDTVNNTQLIRILSDGSGFNFSDARLSAAGWGDYLNSTERTALRSRLRTYLIAVGAI